MKKNSIIIVVGIIVIVIVVLFIYNGSTKKEESDQNNTPAVSTNQNSPQLFADSPLSQNAYLISALVVDAKTEEATMGFTITKKTLADGSMQITLNSQNPEYQTQTYTVKSGEKLYFVEKFLTDDSENADKNIKDDTAILVDANGYIVGQ